ncbi:MAG TPA: acyl-CoA dehydrogenase family protein [Mycobacteriales bacterium]|nr:acyl-CoA dehydrogenase family protein [Mycobacteriales bacterium]
MPLIATPEQEELRRSLRRFLQQVSGREQVRALLTDDAGYDPAVWHRMATELGLQGLALPEQFGGSGATFAELGVVFEEFGRALVCAPFLSSVVLTGHVLLAVDDPPAQARWLPGIADGTLLATLAVPAGAGHDRAAPLPQATASAGGWRLDGTVMFVPDAQIAQLLLIAARTPAGTSVFAVRAGATGLDRTALPNIDLTRRVSRVDLHATPAELIGPQGGADAALQRALQLATVALAAEQVGGAQACLDMAVGYACTREQFGRPIGSFQAIKHQCADLQVQVVSARSAATWACGIASGEQDPAQLPLAAALAGAYCADAFVTAAKANLQIHGGIGFTWEHDAHLYLKRAKSGQLLLGTPDQHRDTAARLMGITHEQ